MSHQELQPYIGLKPFTEQEKDRFFGRDRELSILLDKIRANRLTLLLAASGVGKSSLLQAGIMPELRADGNSELIYHRDWATEPSAALKENISQHYAEQHGLADFGGKFAQLSLKDTLRACTLFSSGQQIILLDQFEEFFNYQRFQAEFLTFVRELSAAVLDRSLPAAFVFSMREDFALELNAFKSLLPGIFDNYFRLEKLPLEQARQAIAEPLKKTGYCFAPQQGAQKALLEQVLDDLAKREYKGQLGVQELMLVEPPHLQIVCHELWQHHRDKAAKQITHAAYEKAGQAAGILEQYFLSKIKSFSKREQVLASAAFDHLIGQRSTKVAHSLERLAELVRADAQELHGVLEKLQGCAVLRPQKRGEEFWYELYHDIFAESIDKWNREFKARQRLKRLACGAVAMLIAGGLLFAGNNWQANYYGRYLQLSPRETISDRIEIYQGTLSSWDVFHQRKFLYEMPFVRREMEPDKLFYQMNINENNLYQQEMISHLPISDRFSGYMYNGFYQTGYRLSECILHSNEFFKTTSQPENLSFVRSKRAVQQLIPLLDQRHNTASAIDALFELHVQEAIPICRVLLKENNSEVQAAALKAIANLSEEKAVSDFIYIVKIISENDWFLQSAVDQIVRILNPEEAIPKVMMLLHDQDADTRAEAIKMLAALHADEAVPEVVILLNDNDSYVRENAVKFLGTLGVKKVIPEIRKFMIDKEPYVQAAAIHALGEMYDKEMIDKIRACAFDRNFFVQMAAINVLGALHDIESISQIRTYLKSRMFLVQSSAITVLANLNDTESIPEIRKIAANESNYMSSTAFKALGTFHDTESIPVIRQLVGNKRAPSEAIEAIATFRDEEAVLAIKDNNYQLDSTSIKALATLHDSESIAEIRKLVLNKSVQTAVVEALAALHDVEALAEIRRFLGSAEPNLQLATVKALRVLHDSRAVPAIRRLIGKGDWQVQEAAIRALGILNEQKAIPQINERLADRYPDIQFAAAQALARLKHSSPQLLAWQQKQLEKAREKAVSEYPDERTEAAKNLASIFTTQSVELLDKLIDDAEQSVVMPAVESLGIIGEYAPGLVQKQIPKLLALTNHDHLDLQEEAVNALGRLISFRGTEKAVDFSETDQKIRSVFRAFILDQEPKNSFRRTVAADALGATGRQECAHDFASLLHELKDEPRYYRCLYWMKRLETDDSSGDALQKKLQKELDELTANKEIWRQKRDEKQGSPSTDATFTSNAEQDNDAWRMEPMEHLLGNALSRIDSEKTGIELLGHSLYQVRQGAIRALAAKADAALIGKIIQAHQDFDPDDLPSPFPYAAFQAIDLCLWNLEYTGKADDLKILQNILANLKPCQIPGQEGAIKERLEWTIKRLEEKKVENSKG